MSQENETKFSEYLLKRCYDGHAQAKVDKELFGSLPGFLLDQWPNISLKVNFRDNYLTIHHPKNPDLSLYIDVVGGDANVQHRVSDESPRGYRWTHQEVFSDLEKNIDPLLQEIEKFLSDTERNR